MPITDNAICKIATQFRVAIEAARDANFFTRDLVFWNFPRGCCGDTCDMLAEHLRRRGVKTIYVCGDDNGQSHAWLEELLRVAPFPVLGGLVGEEVLDPVVHALDFIAIIEAVGVA